MSLPVIPVPEDTIKLWSLPTPVRMRPYLVGEEKLLLIAQQTNDPVEIDKAVRQIIARCTFDGLDVKKLPSFDVEWFFLQLRSRSVSNIIESHFKCQNDVPNPKLTDDPTAPSTVPCGAPVKVVIDIGDIKMTVPEGHTNKVWLNDDLGVTLKYPTSEVTSEGDVVDLLLAHLDNVFTKNGDVTEVSEQKPEDVKAWIETLQMTHVQKIQTFFDTMPRLTHTFEFKCPKCGYTENVTLRGLLDFFD